MSDLEPIGKVLLPSQVIQPGEPCIDCMKCGDTGWKMVDIPDERKAGQTRRVAERCECAMEKRKAALMKRARIPERYGNGFAEYDTDFPSAGLSLGQAKITAMKFVEEYAPKCSGLLLVGPLGVGKTHLACSALHALVSKGIPGLFYSYADLLTEIRNTYNDNGCAKYSVDLDGNRWETESQILNHVINVEVLLLDELGKVKATDWVLDKIREIIGGRYDKQRTTLVTTNFPLAAQRTPGTSGQILLQEKIGADMVSRLREMCRVVPMEGVDFRQNVKAVNYR